MNLEKLSRMPLPVLAAGMVIGGVSCVNEQYDLNKGIDDRSDWPRKLRI